MPVLNVFELLLFTRSRQVGGDVDALAICMFWSVHCIFLFQIACFWSDCVSIGILLVRSFVYGMFQFAKLVDRMVVKC